MLYGENPEGFMNKFNRSISYSLGFPVSVENQLYLYGPSTKENEILQLYRLQECQETANT